jgi:hypothetical protein
VKHVICAIYDSATEAYMRPWTAQSEGQAMRIFSDEVFRPDSEIGKHKEDYSLFLIGTFNDGSGELEVPEFKCLARAHELKSGD